MQKQHGQVRWKIKASKINARLHSVLQPQRRKGEKHLSIFAPVFHTKKLENTRLNEQRSFRVRLKHFQACKDFARHISSMESAFVF